MPVVAFDMTTSNYEHRRSEFRGRNKADYYDGELKILAGNEVDMRIEKSCAGEFGIYKLTAHAGLGFRRSCRHIRADNTNLTIIWFLRRGRMTISHSDRRHVIQSGECTITRSSNSFYMELTPDDEGVLEVLHVTAPSHRLYLVLNDNVEMGQPFSASKGDMYLTERIISLLFEEDGRIDPENAGHLVETLLAGVARTLEHIVGAPTPPPTISDRRLADITRHIDQNFPNLDLNAKMVAESCGISLRYLCQVLKKNDLSFSSLLWDRRMAAASQWLGETKMRYAPISEIAYLAGFKSSAHFSRMFKTRCGVAPRDYRQQRLIADTASA
jgi:AraC family transcriptional activator of tynA and feaB